MVTVNINVDYKYLNSDIVENISNKIREQYIGKVIDETYYILNIYDITINRVYINRSNSCIMANVSFNIKKLQPIIDKVMKGIIIKNGEKIFVKIKNKLICYIPNVKNIENGKEVFVKIVNQNHIRFNGKDIICIAELI
ncbi:hypothetical protein AGMMS49579_15250 [Spirochaetia bacterium]|nr:hypothetical protein AGMMS49579_15250 [Spirochaetia bacterium]